MSKLRWLAVAAVLVGLAVVVMLMSPLLRGPMLSDGEPDPSATPGPAPSGCPVSEKLVPECGSWWGAAPGVFTSTPPAHALAEFEAKTGRRADIYHRYHRGDQLFPTPGEIAAARDPEGGRVLMLNWKVAWGTTWADVAAGGQDERIDRLAGHIRANFSESFFLAIHHEPEDDVSTDPDSGMTAHDYAAMYRHTVERLRGAGVDNAVFVMVYMGYQGWGVEDWFDELYPGDDVVDWIGFDPYVSADPDAWHYGNFARLVNQTDDPEAWPGFYNWAVANHPGKPLMLAEWGVFEYHADSGSKAGIIQSVERYLPYYPALKGLVYFDSPRAPRGNTSVDSSPQALHAFRAIASLPVFTIRFPDWPDPPAPVSPRPTSPRPSPSPSGSPSPGASPSPSGSSPFPGSGPSTGTPPASLSPASSAPVTASAPVSPRSGTSRTSRPAPATRRRPGGRAPAPPPPRRSSTRCRAPGRRRPAPRRGRRPR